MMKEGQEKAYKYMKLVNWIKEQVSSGRFSAGEKLPTETALAEQFSVSRHTVRQAIAFMEKEGMLYSVQGSGTYFSDELDIGENKVQADKPETASSRSVGLLLSDSNNYIFPDIVQGASEYLMSKGYFLNVAFTGNRFSQEREVLDTLLKSNLAGLIVEPLNYGMTSYNDEVYAEIAEKIPMLMIHTDRSSVCPALSICDREGGYLVTKYLLDMGHKEINSIYAFDETTASSRYAGILNALQDYGIEHNEKNDIWIKRSNLSDLFHPDGKLALDRILNNASAIICHDDRIAYAIIMHLRDRGVCVPEDISVVGYDDSFYATLDMQITSVTHPKREYGRSAAKAILEMIQNPDEFDINKYIVHPKLVVRNSVKKIEK